MRGPEERRWAEWNSSSQKGGFVKRRLWKSGSWLSNRVMLWRLLIKVIASWCKVVDRKGVV